MLLAWLLIAFHPAAGSSAAGAPPPISSVDRDERPPLRLVTVVDERTDVRGLRLSTVLAQAEAIWRPHVLLRATTGTEVGPSCDASLTLRLTDRHHDERAAQRQLTPGWIDFVGGEPSQTINVSPRAARQWAGTHRFGGQLLADLPPRAAAPLVERALGWSVAHEIGHYLLRSAGHTADGLMKARFTAGDIAGHLPSATRGLEAGRLAIPRAAC